MGRIIGVPVGASFARCSFGIWPFPRRRNLLGSRLTIVFREPSGVSGICPLRQLADFAERHRQAELWSYLGHA